jgi:HK97 family phage major capsid protein
MDKQKVFDDLKAKGLIPDGFTAEDMTEEKLTELSLKAATPTEPQKQPDSLSMKDFEAMMHKNFDKIVKDYGIDQIDRKYMKLPGIELTDEEKLIPDERTKANIKMRKFITNIMATKTLNSESSNAAGLYTVPEEFRAEVIRLLNQYGIFRRNATVLNMSSKTLKIPKLLTAPSGAFVDETSAKGESNPTFDQLTLTRNEYAFITGVSNQLLQDTAIDLIGLLAELAANDFAKAEDTQGFLGTGSPITGWASASDIVEITNGTAKVTYATALLYDILVETVTGIPSVALDGAKWFMHPSILGVIMKITDSASKPIFSDILTRGTAFANILGHPYELSSLLPATSDAVQTAKPFCFFGNLKYAYFGQRNTMSMLASDIATVGSNSAFEKNLTFFRFEQSFDIDFALPTALARITAD